MSRRRRGSNPRSARQEGYDEYSLDNEDEWGESEDDHATHSPSTPSRGQRQELAEEGVTQFYESEDDDSNADSEPSEPSLQNSNEQWVGFHQNIGKFIEIVEESQLEDSLRSLVIEDLTAQKKIAEKNILANEFTQLAEKYLGQEAITTTAFQKCMKAGLEVASVILNASTEETPTINLPVVSDVDMAIKTARKQGLLSESTRREIDRQDGQRRFLEEMTKFQNDARKLGSHKFPEFSAMLRFFVPDELDLEYSKDSSMVDGNHKDGQEN